MKIGVIDVGGGMRGAYSAGVYDWCLDNGISFDYCMGISAGSANLCSFLAGQRGRNFQFYSNYSLRDESISMRNYVRTRNFVDLDYIYGTVSNTGGECPLDYEALQANPAEFKIVATDALSGEPYYFDKSDIKPDDCGPVKASSCVPAANRPYYVNGTYFYDGGISDPIPLNKCWKDGCDKIVLILSRPRDYERSPQKDRLATALLKPRYPNASRAMSRRAAVYNSELRHAKEYERQGKLLIVAPDDIGDMKTLTKDKDMITELYNKGYRDAEAIRDFVK